MGIKKAHYVMSINRALRTRLTCLIILRHKYAGLFWNGKRKAEIFCFSAFNVTLKSYTGRQPTW